MPNRLTFTIPPIKELLAKEVDSGTWLDPFARDSCLSNMFVKVITNDLNPECKTDFHMEAVDFLKQYPVEYADGVLCDPPYSPRQIMECYQGIGIAAYNTRVDFYSSVKDQIARVTKLNGRVISFGWSSMGMGKSRGFEIVKILLVPHGGNKNDTIVTVERKIA
jgi:hypothetical protein